MCGIAGIFRLGDAEPGPGQKAQDLALVDRMLSAIAYRGPDDIGIETAGRATLGARRLAILDIEGGHQPLADASSRVWAVHNGEIYNFPALRDELAARHPLRTHTDTEVLPWLWLERGPDLVHALEGMFGIAVYDTVQRTLLLARDPLGIKPLYHATVGDRLLFASELKCLLCDPALGRELDHDAIARYLALGFVPGTATPFRAIRKLRPGSRLVARPEGARIERWWPWPAFVPDPSLATQPPGALVEEVESRLAASTRSMLLSDRPLGILLSGGVDSSVLVALLPEEVRRATHTFAIGFEDAGHHDERVWARCVAGRLGTRHQEFTVPLDVGAELPRVVRFLDEPCADPAAVPAHLVARAAAREVTVLLSGTGGDELFGGYRRYRLPSLLRRTRLVPAKWAGAWAEALGDSALHRRTRAGEQRVMLRKLLEARSRGSFLDAYLSAFEPASPARWEEAVSHRPDAIAAGLATELRDELAGSPEGDAFTAFAVDHLWYLPDDLLLKEDRTTMGASVEGRVPYLDSRLVRFAAGLPLAARFRNGESKWILREIARRHLPPDVASRPKHGFSVPIEDWLKGPLDDLLGGAFGTGGSGVFRSDVLRRWQEQHRAGRDRAGGLWAALCFELWWREVGSATPDTLVAAGTAAAVSRLEAERARAAVSASPIAT